MWYLPRNRHVPLQHYHDIWQGKKKVYYQFNIQSVDTP